MNTAVTTKKEHPLAVIQQAITSRKEGFAAALPAHIPSDKFMRVILTAITNNTDLAACTTKSIVGECMKAASDGLVLDGREAVLVSFNVKVSKKSETDRWEKQAKYIPMYQGLMKLGRNSGEISSLSAVLVHKNDEFSYHPGVDEIPNHRPEWFSDRGEAIGAYAVARLKDGSSVVEVMSEAQIMKIAAKTKNAYQYQQHAHDGNKPGDSWGEWWRKTVIRRISKYLPSSTDKDSERLINAVHATDDLYEPDEQPAEAPQPRKKRAAAGILNGAATASDEPEIPASMDRRRRGADIIDGETGEVMEENQPIDGDGDRDSRDGDMI